MPIIGEPAPDFEMLTDEGQTTKLSDYRGKKVVLYFYPKDFTGGCEFQACKFRDNIDTITSHNAVVLGVSPDDVDSHNKFREALKLPFNLLVDADTKYAKQWGAYGTKTLSDGSTIEGLIRSQFVIDETGKLVDVRTPVDYRQSIELALAALQPTGV